MSILPFHKYIKLNEIVLYIKFMCYYIVLMTIQQELQFILIEIFMVIVEKIRHGLCELCDSAELCY